MLPYKVSLCVKMRAFPVRLDFEEHVGTSALIAVLEIDIGDGLAEAGTLGVRSLAGANAISIRLILRTHV